MEKRYRRNAIIENASITKEDHGLLTVWLTLNYGGTFQCFGGHSLYLPKSFKNHQLLSHAGHFMFRVLEIAGVERWDQLNGKSIRVDSEISKVHGIGHVVNENWFYPEIEFKTY